ncbi:MAG TPA: YhcH/YjgK/YiaL family protein [Bacteroidales bacterium]|jgi:YhcH/YjgK/YiaL family protein|nr:DUF386 family protein [Bacteroidales bacterium]HNR42112.1 YhcH/YjgK/YiaL family protein [Bacteroidales bacterium]HQG78366.1 YhcH/YjgK/YiaL family protein [Bacteroidales bacterium]
MKSTILQIALFSAAALFAGCSGNNDPSAWSGQKLDRWFEKGEWLNGLKAVPDQSVSRKTFAVSYFRNKDRWDKAFVYLKNISPDDLEPGRHDIDGDNLYASVSEYISKDPEEAQYEAHRKYIDIQYVLSGKELIGLAPASELDELLEEYDPEKDIEFMTVRNPAMLNAVPGRLFFFFPGELHCPGLKDGENSPVKKVVIKVKVD